MALELLLIEKGIVTDNRINSVLDLPKGLAGAEGEDMRAVANSLQGRASQAGALFGRLCVDSQWAESHAPEFRGGCRLVSGAIDNESSISGNISGHWSEQRDTTPSPPDMT
jgi:hypothetical protein